MNLSFSILWIEDDDDFYNSGKELIEEFLESLCIEPIIIHKKTISNEEVKEIGNKYDAIFIDYNLPNDYLGTEIIEQIRSNSLLPDIVFYSSLSSVDDIIEKEKKIRGKDLLSLLRNGIYFATSNKMTNTAIGVIRKILARDEKINGFKGLVLSSISKFESDVDSLLLLLINRMNNEQKEQLYKYVFKHIIENDMQEIKKYYPEVGTPLENCFPRIIEPDNRHLDHNKRVRIMKKALSILKLYDFNSEKYFELTSLRNSLGHIPTDNELLDKEVIIKVGKENIVFNHQFVIDTRTNINSWKSVFSEIKEKLSE